MYNQAEQIKRIVDDAQRIVIVQADNPDADSLGSALALEHILGDLGKQPQLYCGVDVPGYLRYLAGWDRVEGDLPANFDASIFVDVSTLTLLEKLATSGQKGWLAAKPCIVLDHHESVDNVIDFADVILNDSGCSSTGELIYRLAKQLGWPLSTAVGELLMTAVLGDTQGLTNQLATANTYKLMAELTEQGVDRPRLEDARREYTKMPSEIYRYKGELIARTNFAADGQLAWVSVPQDEINTFSPLYNPAPLIQGDMLLIKGVRVAIVFKSYDDGKVTAAIRCNHGAGIAASLAEHFGGGGHAYASGFKVLKGRDLGQITDECISKATELLATLVHKDEASHETLQHSHQTN